MRECGIDVNGKPTFLAQGRFSPTFDPPPTHLKCSPRHLSREMPQVLEAARQSPHIARHANSCNHQSPCMLDASRTSIWSEQWGFTAPNGLILTTRVREGVGGMGPGASCSRHPSPTLRGEERRPPRDPPGPWIVSRCALRGPIDANSGIPFLLGPVSTQLLRNAWSPSCVDLDRIGGPDRVGFGSHPPRRIVPLNSYDESVVTAEPSTPIAPDPIHRPVLLDEVVTWLAPREGSVIVDGTVGAGGHAAALRAPGRGGGAGHRPRPRPRDAGARRGRDGRAPRHAGPVRPIVP